MQTVKKFWQPNKIELRAVLGSAILEEKGKKKLSFLAKQFKFNFISIF